MRRQFKTFKYFPHDHLNQTLVFLWAGVCCVIPEAGRRQCFPVSAPQRSLENINITICPSGICCGLLIRTVQAVFNKQIQHFQTTQPELSVHNASRGMQPNASAAWTDSLMPVCFGGVITVESAERCSLVTKCCRKREQLLISCNTGKSSRLKAAQDLYDQHSTYDYTCHHVCGAVWLQVAVREQSSSSEPTHFHILWSDIKIKDSVSLFLTFRWKIRKLKVRFHFVVKYLTNKNGDNRSG